MRLSGGRRGWANAFERLTAASLAAAAFSGPLLLGATAPWPRFALDVAMGVAAVAWALACRRRLALISVPVAVAGLAALQAAKLPDSLLSAIAPISAVAWRLVHAAGPAAWGSISVDPGTSLRGARQILLALSTIIVVADVARDTVNRRIVTTSLAVVGLAIMLLAAVFPPTTGDRLSLGFIDLSGPIWFWKTPVDLPVQTAGFSESDVVTVAGQRYVSDSWIVGDRVGCYVVSNHYAGGLCLTLPFLLGAWMSFARHRLPRWTRLFGLASVTCFAFWTVAVVARSRAGTVALILTVLVFIWLAAERRCTRLTFGALAGLAAVTILCGVVSLHGPLRHLVWLVPAAVRPTVDSLLGDARALASHLAFRMWAAAPLFGAGLGSYYELAARMLPGSPWAFAHNDYAQLLAETGIAGSAVVGAGIGQLGWSGWRFAQSPPDERSPLDAAPWAALAGIAAHSFFDWNLHVPANALLTTVAAGLAMATVPQRPIRGVSARLPSRAWACVFTAAVLLSTMLLGRDAMSDAVERTMRAAEADARLYAADRSRPSPKSAVEEAVRAGFRAAKRDPGNAHLWLVLGQLELHLADLDQAAKVSRVEAASSMFDKARRACAVVRGLAEPVAALPETGAMLDLTPERRL